MPSTSADALADVISALAARIRDLKLQLRANDKPEDELSEDEIEAHVELQDTVAQYGRVLASLRDEYEVVLALGLVGGLPSYDKRTSTPALALAASFLQTVSLTRLGYL